MKKSIVFLAFLLMSVLGFAQKVEKVSSEQAKELISSKKIKQIVDIRSPQEFKYVGHIAKAINIYYLDPNFSTMIDKKTKPKKSILLYCQAGLSVDDASQYFVSKGFKQIYLLENGINDWKRHKLPIVH
mgnify:FL=1|jgi:rhodanese-related sulfurtransferase